MTALTFTFAGIRAARPCKDSWGTAIATAGLTSAEARVGTTVRPLAEILDSNGLTDARGMFDPGCIANRRQEAMAHEWRDDKMFEKAWSAWVGPTMIARGAGGELAARRYVRDYAPEEPEDIVVHEGFSRQGKILFRVRGSKTQSRLPPGWFLLPMAGLGAVLIGVMAAAGVTLLFN